MENYILSAFIGGAVGAFIMSWYLSGSIKKAHEAIQKASKEVSEADEVLAEQGKVIEMQNQLIEELRLAPQREALGRRV